MAEEKQVSVMNRGRRNYDFGKDAAGNPRVLRPGQVLVMSESEASKVLGRRDLIDASKLVKVPSQAEKDKRIKELEAENAKLKDKQQAPAADAPAAPDAQAPEAAPKKASKK